MKYTMLNILISLLSFLLVVFVIVCVHELGHFVCARCLGVRVDTFSIGFGKELYGWTDSKNTRWKISVLPLGGYVKFYGDDNVASLQASSEAPPEKGAFFTQSWLTRLTIALAGPIANFVLSSVLWGAIFFVVGVATLLPIVEHVMPHSPAEMAGFEKGDRIVRMGTLEIDDAMQVGRIVSQRSGKKIEVWVSRHDKIISLPVTPDASGRIGVAFALPKDGQGVIYKHVNLFQAAKLGTIQTYYTIVGLAFFMKNLVVKAEGASQIGGPIQIAKVSGQAAQMGLAALFYVMALLSVSIGFINLLPIPLLDGGHVFLCLLEGILRRPLGKGFTQAMGLIGFLILAFIFVMAMWNDVMHLSFIQSVLGRKP